MEKKFYPASYTKEAMCSQMVISSGLPDPEIPDAISLIMGLAG